MMLGSTWRKMVLVALAPNASAACISDELLKRHGDNVWRMRLRDNWLYLLLLVEFQSTDDPLMALRILTYTGLLYQELARNEQLDADGRLPAVLPIVLYNGDEPWVSPLQMGELIAPVGPLLAPYQPAQRYFVLDERRVAADDLPSRNRMSAVVGLEQSRSLSEVARVAEELAAWLPDQQVRRAFADWMRQIVERLVPSGAELPPIRKLEEVSMTLVERAAEWSKEWQKEGLERGLEQGIEQGIEQGLEHGTGAAVPNDGGALRSGHRRTPGRAVGAHHRHGASGRSRRLAGAVRHRRRLPRPRGHGARRRERRRRRELGRCLSQRRGGPRAVGAVSVKAPVDRIARVTGEMIGRGRSRIGVQYDVLVVSGGG